MEGKMLHKSRRQRYRIGIMSAIIVLIVTSITILDVTNCYLLILCFQCLIPLLCVSLAGVLVSLPAKIVRSKILLVGIFGLLLVFGIIVNAHWSENMELERSKNPLEIILLPFNTTLASFFPSRGDYNLKDIQEGWHVPYLVFHTLTYFYVAWLGFSLFGRKLLNRTSLVFIPYKHKNLFWGYSEGGIELAKDMIDKTEWDEPIFILDDDIEFEAEKENRIFDKLSNNEIVAVNTHYDNLSESELDFEKAFSWHRIKRMLTQGKYFGGHRHYFITEDQDFNVKYALVILKQLSFQKTTLEGKTHLFVRSEQEGIDAFFQEKLKDGLSDKVEIHIFNQSDITARGFVKNYPILDLAKRTNPSTGRKWLTIHHDTLQAEGEVNILLLGLGWTGYEILRKEVCDAQFIGDYKINVVVVDNDYKLYHGRYQYIVQEAARFGVNICINPLVWIDNSHNIQKQWLKGEKCSKENNLEEKWVHQANGHLFYEWLGFTDPEIGMANILYFNRIIVALGSDELNVNTALQLTKFRNLYLGVEENHDTSLMPEPIFAHVRDRERYSYHVKRKEATIRIFGGLKSIYKVLNLTNEKMDEIAKLVNYVYTQYQKDFITEEEIKVALNDNSVEKEWAKCCIFDQDSSRAVAMNLENIVTLAGGLQRLTDIVNAPLYMDRLSELEHKRWNAFHYMRGIRTWETDKVQEAYDGARKKKANGKLYFNGALVRHICLVDFDQLEEATFRVRLLGNTNEDFKASDRRIIRHFPIFYKIKQSS